MKKKHHIRMKVSAFEMIRGLKDDRDRDRKTIDDLRQRLNAATVKKNTEMDALILRLRESAEAMREQVRHELGSRPRNLNTPKP